MQIISVVGARPQFVKLAMVGLALRDHPDIDHVIVHTGQHYDDHMSAVFFDQLGIPKPSYNLGVGSLPHGAQTARMIEALEPLLETVHPTWVVVVGDTNSTLAGALAASKLDIPVAHIEAGLRSFNRKMPEEINRIVTDHIATRLFAPTAVAVQHLVREGLPGDAIVRSGDVMYDACVHFGDLAERSSTILATHELEPGYVLATLHRAENTDDMTRLNTVFRGLAAVGEHVPVVLPLHPRTRNALDAKGLRLPVHPNFTVISPVGYLDMLMLEQHAAVVATDSGGMQKESYFFRTPCVTLRDETEWVELVEAGWNTLCPPTDADRLAECVLGRIGSAGTHDPDYGDGNASHVIADTLLRPLD